MQAIVEEDAMWLDPTSEEWAGYRQSAEPNAHGTYYALCKCCGETLEALLDDMKAHKERCESSKDPEGIFFEEQHHHQDVDEMDPNDGVVVHEEEVEDRFEVEPRKKQARRPPAPVLSVKRQIVNPLSTSSSGAGRATPSVVTSPGTSSSQPASCQCPTKPPSRFADMAKVWERKLEELPLEQALEIEKKMSDMLYEAMLTHLQAQKAFQAGK